MANLRDPPVLVKQHPTSMALAKRHLARKNSPKQWLGEFLPLDVDEAIMYGPVFEKDARAYGEHITHALYGSVAGSSVWLRLYQGSCIGVDVDVQHVFFTKTLEFYLPPAPANEIVQTIWTSITTAMSRPNVDPVALARESLRYDSVQSIRPWHPIDYSLFQAAQE